MGKYDEQIMQDDSVEEIVDMVLELGGEIPYLEISPEKETTRYCEKKNIPVENIGELKLFYNNLEDKLEEIRDSDERAQKYFEHRAYEKQLHELPDLLNKFENISLYKLKPKFEAVMEYVYDAVINNGFIMNNELAKIHPYRNKKVSFEIMAKGGKSQRTNFYLSKKRKKQNQDNLRIKLTGLVGIEQNSRMNSYPSLTTKEIFKKFDNFLLNPDIDERAEILVSQIRYILSLPTIMNKYLKKRISTLEGCLKQIKD